MALGSEIKKAMIDAGLTGRQLAADLGITEKYMSQILNDKAPGLTVELFKRICLKLSADADVLLGLDVERQVK